MIASADGVRVKRVTTGEGVIASADEVRVKRVTTIEGV